MNPHGAALAFLATIATGCSGGSCPGIYIPSLVVSVVENATGRPVCDASVVVTNEAGTTMGQQPSFTSVDCAVEIFDASKMRAPPGKYLARATLNGRTDQANVIVPAFDSCGPADSLRVVLRL